MKKIAASLLLIFLAFAIIQTLPVQAVTPKENAINLGLAWLAGQQDTATGAWSLSYFPVAHTAFAVLKFEEYANRTLGIDPFSDGYVYKDKVATGLDYIFEHAVPINITAQYAGNPDTDGGTVPPGTGDGLGVYFTSPNGYHPVYETGIVMMALEASCHPEFTASVSGGTWTYRRVMEDAVDYVAWAQNDYPSSGEGGWRYEPNETQADNSASQWPVVGLIAAEAWGLFAPNWVRTELNHWLEYSQYIDGTGSGYDGAFGYESNADRREIALAAAGIIQLYYEGALYTDSRVQAAFSFIARDWTGGVTGTLTGWPLMYARNFGNFYAMYAVMKACVLYDIIAPNGSSNGNISGTIDWQAEYDSWLISNQTSGSWGLYWVYNQILSTEWALLILEKVAPPPVLSARIGPTSAKIKIGENVTFTSSVSGGSPPYSYQWYLNGSAVSAATSPTWTFAPTSMQPIGNYTVYVIVTDNLTNTATSNTAIVTVAPPLLASISPMSASILPGQSVTFTSTVSGGYPPYSYQWYLNGNPDPGATSSTWTFTPTAQGIYYVYLKVIDTTNNTAQSDTARIIVTTPPVGGYSVSIEAYGASKPITPYLALTAILCVGLVAIKRKIPRRKK